MKEEYKVKPLTDNTYEVSKTTTIFGERTSAYDSDPNKVETKNVFKGSLSDCESYIRLHEGGYMC